MKNFIHFVILLVIPITGCVASDVPPSVTAQPSETIQPAISGQHTSKIQLVNLNGFKTKGKEISLQVMSNGCTKAKSFKLIWQDDNLTVQRLKPDFCRRVPHKIWLKFEIPQQIKEFSVTNQFIR